MLFKEFFSNKIFFFALLTFVDCENVSKFEEMKHVENLPPIYLPFQFLQNLQPFYFGKKSKNKIYF